MVILNSEEYRAAPGLERASTTGRGIRRKPRNYPRAMQGIHDGLALGDEKSISSSAPGCLFNLTFSTEERSDHVHLTLTEKFPSAILAQTIEIRSQTITPCGSRFCPLSDCSPSIKSRI